MENKIELEQAILRGERCQVCGGLFENIEDEPHEPTGKPETCEPCQHIIKLNGVDN